MLRIQNDLRAFQVGRGEPFLMEVQLLDQNSQALDIPDDALSLTLYDSGSTAIVHQENGERRQDGTGEYFRWAYPGTFTQEHFGKSLKLELSRRYKDGRIILINAADLAIGSSAASVPSLASAPIGDIITRISIKANAQLGGSATVSISLRSWEGALAPTFTTEPAIDHDGTPIAGETASLTWSTISGGASTLRQVLLNGTALTGAIGPTITLQAGTYRLREVAEGTGGTSEAFSAEVVVAPKPTVTLSPDLSYPEGNSGPRLFTFTVSRSASAGVVDVAWTFAAGGTSAADFTGGTLPAGGTVAMADGQSSGTFTISVAGDTLVELDEAFTVSITAPAGYAAGARMAAIGTITNDDAPPMGTTATSFPIPPDIQWHAGQSANTKRAHTQVTGYIVDNLLTVTAVNGGALLEGLMLVAGVAAGTKIVKAADNATSGGVGKYYVMPSQNVGSAGAPATFSVDTLQIATFADLKGRCNLNSADGEGPRLMVDGLGRPFLRFIAPKDNKGSWLQNTVLAGLDSHNTTVVAVVRWHGAGGQYAPVVCLGSETAGTGTGNGAVLRVTQDNMPSCHASIDPRWNFQQPMPNLNRLLVGTQLSVVGCGITTDEGLGGSGGSSNTRIAVNETSGAVFNEYSGRASSATGLEIGKMSNTPAGQSYPGHGFFDLYELSLWTQGQMGNKAQLAARFDAAVAAAVANFAVPAITDSLIIAGDSRTANGTSFGSLPATQAWSGNDGSGINIATLLTEPGAPYALPATVRVINNAAAGTGVGAQAAGVDVDATVRGQYDPQNYYHPSRMLGGGHDYIHYLNDVNDIVGTNWPRDNWASDTAGLADELYGTDRTNSFNGSITDGSNRLTYTNLMGVAFITGVQVSGPSTRAGLSTGAGASPVGLNVFQSPASSGAMTGRLRSMKSFVELLLQRGFKVTVAQGTNIQVNAGPGIQRLRTRVAAMKTDVTASLGASLAANLTVYAPQNISQGGKTVFGAQTALSDPANPYYASDAHLTAAGKRLLLTGGDTPANGLRANLPL